MMTRLSFSRVGAFLLIATFAASCTSASRVVRHDSSERVYVLPGADRELDREIARAEGSGPRLDSSLLASLRLTREARDMIVEGRDDRAFDQLKRAIEVNGDQGFSYLYLAHLYISDGDASQGLVFLQRAEALLPPSRELDAAVTGLLARAAANG